MSIEIGKTSKSWMDEIALFSAVAGRTSPGWMKIACSLFTGLGTALGWIWIGLLIGVGFRLAGAA